MNGCVKVSVLMGAMVALSACGAHIGASSAPRDVSLRNKVAPAGVTRGQSAAFAEAAGPHGPEIESGSVITVNDGNVHMGYPGYATVARTADGVLVSLNGKTRKFSRTATVSTDGSYHIYAPVSH